MVRKTTLFKRKFSSFFPIFFFSFALFVGVFALCFGVWVFITQPIAIQSPLPVFYTVTTRIQSLCLVNHLHCTQIVVHNDKTVTVTIDSDESVIFSLAKNLSQQFASLQLTIAHLTIEGKRFSRLDFRFDNPVISY